MGQDQTAVAPACRELEGCGDASHPALGTSRRRCSAQQALAFASRDVHSFGQSDDGCRDVVPEEAPPNPGLCQSLPAESQAERGGGSSFVTNVAAADAAMQEYGQIDCGQPARTDANTWPKAFTGRGQTQICDFPPGRRGAYPPNQ